MKHKKEKLKFPLFLEDYCHLFSKEQVDELRKDYVPYEGLMSHGIQRNLFPGISQGVYSDTASKSQVKLPVNGGLFSLGPLTQQRGKESQYQQNPWSQMEDNSDLS